MMRSLLRQLKRRRLELGLTQNDMMLRVGILRQQYQRLESKGNPRLETLELVAQGLKSELMLIPRDKVKAVKTLLESSDEDMLKSAEKAHENLVDNPWDDLLEDDNS